MHVRRPLAFFRRGNLDLESEPENVTNLIEIMPIPSRQNPDN